MIPISPETLLDENVIESSRIEYKRDWNPEKILHTVCAFANDIDNIGGGYIILGIGEIDGRPADYAGIDEGAYSRIEKELFRVCNTISPRYVPDVLYTKVRGTGIITIWAPGGESRPYRCPVSLSEKKKDRGESAYYIRKLSNTVRADRDEEVALIRRSSKIPFDDMISETGTVRDIRPMMIQEFLGRTRSRMDIGTDSLTLFRSLRLVRGPPEMLRPVNIALMMFNEHPEDFFRGARIEVVIMPDDTGQGMTEKVFDTALDDQIRSALSYIRNTVIEEKVYKVPDRAEALRFFNYPYEAVEETVVNAVYHKDYEIPEPVTVTVRPDRIEVYNCPGPDISISDERIKKRDLRCEYHLNRRLGDFLKELRLAEGRNTGIPKVLNSLEQNGSDMPTYETDQKRRFLRVTIPIHPEFLPKPSVSGNGDTAAYRTSDPDKGAYRPPEMTKAAILESLRNNECQSSKALAASVGYRGINNTFRRCLAELMKAGRIEYLFPGTPRDKRQKICLSKRNP